MSLWTSSALVLLGTGSALAGTLIGGWRDGVRQSKAWAREREAALADRRRLAYADFTSAVAVARVQTDCFHVGGEQPSPADQSDLMARLEGSATAARLLASDSVEQAILDVLTAYNALGSTLGSLTTSGRQPAVDDLLEPFKQLRSVVDRFVSSARIEMSSDSKRRRSLLAAVGVGHTSP